MVSGGRKRLPPKSRSGQGQMTLRNPNPNHPKVTLELKDVTKPKSIHSITVLSKYTTGTHVY